VVTLSLYSNGLFTHVARGEMVSLSFRLGEVPEKENPKSYNKKYRRGVALLPGMGQQEYRKASSPLNASWSHVLSLVQLSEQASGASK
jgi:hypothetical protein